MVAFSLVNCFHNLDCAYACTVCSGDVTNSEDSIVCCYVVQSAFYVCNPCKKISNVKVGEEFKFCKSVRLVAGKHILFLKNVQFHVQLV